MTILAKFREGGAREQFQDLQLIQKVQLNFLAPLSESAREEGREGWR